jgi:hypothetical protein
MTAANRLCATFPSRALARLGGLLYVIIIVLGLFGELGVRGRVIVSGDAVATAANDPAKGSARIATG